MVERLGFGTRKARRRPDTPGAGECGHDKADNAREDKALTYLGSVAVSCFAFRSVESAQSVVTAVGSVFWERVWISGIILDEERQMTRDAGGQWSEAHQGCLIMDDKMNHTIG